jgi:hypothetical protein
MAITIDEALDILHRTGPDLGSGGSNHSPMVAEALFVLGRSDSVLPSPPSTPGTLQRRLNHHRTSRYPQ